MLSARSPLDFFFFFLAPSGQKRERTTMSGDAPASATQLMHDPQEDYDLRKVLGRGSFGAVYFAVRKQDGLECAVKRLEVRRALLRCVCGRWCGAAHAPGAAPDRVRRPNRAAARASAFLFFFSFFFLLFSFWLVFFFFSFFFFLCFWLFVLLRPLLGGQAGGRAGRWRGGAAAHCACGSVRAGGRAADGGGRRWRKRSR